MSRDPYKRNLNCAILMSGILDRHSGESRNPDRHWMPDQIRHDEVRLFNCWIIIIEDKSIWEDLWHFFKLQKESVKIIPI